MKSDYMRALVRSKRLEVHILKSQSISGRMSADCFILLKAPNTTNCHRYTQYLRSILPVIIPYFDVLRYAESPTDQVIPHLVINARSAMSRRYAKPF
jgi:hypothetical protein